MLWIAATTVLTILAQIHTYRDDGEEPQLEQRERVTVLTSGICHDGVHKYSQVEHTDASSLRPELGLQDSW